jgi:hypothetical protein
MLGQLITLFSRYEYDFCLLIASHAFSLYVHEVLVLLGHIPRKKQSFGMYRKVNRNYEKHL